MPGESKNPVVQAISGSLRGIDSSRQLALGIAIGSVIGFVPKENLIFVGLLVALILSGANLITGLTSAAATSLLALQLQNTFHFAGTQILGTEFVSTLLTKAMSWPLFAWTDLNNTVVCGALFVGMALFVPIYFVSFGLFHHFRSKLKALLQLGILRSVISYASK